MLPVLIDAFGAAPDPMRAMNRFDDLVERLPSGVNFYRLLEARPGLTQHLAAILSHAPALAEQLGRRPRAARRPDRRQRLRAGRRRSTSWSRDFGRSDRADEDYQLLLDRVRRRVNERRFALGVQLVARAQRSDRASREGYARVAEAAIQVLAAAAIAEFEQAPRPGAGARSCSSSASAGSAAGR